MKIILTANRTLMSKYHSNEFLGFGTAAPPNVVPELFFKALFFPPIKTRDGIPVKAPYGLRKVGAKSFDLQKNFTVILLSVSLLSSSALHALKYGYAFQV